MSQERKAIRADIVQRLRAAVPEVNQKVFSSRPDQIDTRELPTVCVYTREESVETIDDSPTIQNRTASIAVEILINGSGAIDDQLDDLCAKVEQEMLAVQFPASGLFSTVGLARTEMGFTQDGHKYIAGARLVFEVAYEKRF